MNTYWMPSYRLLIPLPLEVEFQRIRYRLAARQDEVSREWRLLASFPANGEWLMATANSMEEMHGKLYKVGIERYPGSIPDRLLRELARIGKAERVGPRAMPRPYALAPM